jgi:hypothetical protein
MLAVPAAICQESSQSETYRTDNVVVRYSGISDEYAEAIALTVQGARGAALQFGADMPATITVDARVGETTRLFNDGDKSLHLTVKSEAALRKPSESGVFNIYGMCHEVAHLAMYRPIKQRLWMTTAAAEGWPHYFGSRLVDAVYEKEGIALWPDRYDYREDGMQRMKGQLSRGETGEITRGAALWLELAGIIGDEGILSLFKVWGATTVDSADPAPALRTGLSLVSRDPALGGWWDKAAPLFVLTRPKSTFDPTAGPTDQLAGKPVELVNDDGAHISKRSLAGTGHAVLFEAPGNSYYLTSVRVFGSRYGTATPPDEDFHVWLCDAQWREIADFPFPYATFNKGEPQEVILDVQPTRVPRRFVICIGFDPTSTRGVYMYHDKQGVGKSFIGLPGRRGNRFDAGDWLIRAVVDAKSGAPAAAGEGAQVSSKPIELANDDGVHVSSRSVAGTGHAVLFDAPSNDCYLTAVRVLGSRYGTASPPNEDFHVWLCDAQFREIADFSFPYSTFTRGEPQQVVLDVEPTRVPRRFVICIGFNPTSTKGVYMYHDKQGSGKSYMALPGRRGSRFDAGDWLIRAVVDVKSGAPAAGQGAQVSSEPVELANDDGQSAGKRSMAGTGHAVLFTAPGSDWRLTGVRIYGSRYGTGSPPKENFHVWLCDTTFREIADFPFPYSTFTRGDPQDVILDVEPTRVPRRFVICVGFNPTRTKGVYVHHDRQGSGKSYMALPGRQESHFDRGDWLIRAIVEEKPETEP